MKTLILTNEYPPNVYGGAGIHVEHLCEALSKLMEVDVRCFGDQSLSRKSLRVHGFPAEKIPGSYPEHLKNIYQTVYRNTSMAIKKTDADIVHCHTWYTHQAGISLKLLNHLPLVITVHSLEPLRPWKEEQLKSGYRYSCWVEKTALEMADAVIAVSTSTKEDILKHFCVSEKKIHVIPNGIDTNVYQKVLKRDALDKNNIPSPLDYVLFVGRITRQKGINHFLDAAKDLPDKLGVVLLATSPDTPQIKNEFESKYHELKKAKSHVYWIDKMVSREDLVQFYSHASIFCCPSMYEPFGIINLEAMACVTPVVASAVGGIPEVVSDGQTGHLVPVDTNHPQNFAKDLARTITHLYQNKDIRLKMAAAARQHVSDHFSWEQIANTTRALYKRILKQKE